MAYFAPYVDASGLHIPSYTEIRDSLLDAFRGVYGQDVYLGIDSPDYQWISAVALRISDALQSIQVAYNNRAPGTSIGAALDSVIKLNGLARKVPSRSTCEVTLTGTAGTVITGGICQDVAGRKWDLPTPITIGPGGTLTVTAICETLGAIAALAGDITVIVTPTSGWTSVTNAGAAVPGQPVEADSQLRARQAISTAIPSLTRIEGTRAEIAAISGVTRSVVLENFTNVEDDNGLPPHSIWAVVEGGTDADIAAAISVNKSDGCGVNGTTTVAYTRADGSQVNIKFSRPTYVPIYVIANVHLLAEGTSQDLANIKTAIFDYLNSLQIGESVTHALWGAAYSTIGNLALPAFSIQSLLWGIAPAPATSTDLAIEFDHVAQGVLADITVNSV